MALDWQALLYGPTYGVLGVPAVLTLPGTDGAVIDKGADGGDLLVIDKTSTAAIGFKGAEVMTVKPSATVKAPDLASIDLADLRRATIVFNGGTWSVEDHELVPAPTGEGQGEIRLILEAA